MKLLVGLVIGLTLGTVGTIGAGPWEDYQLQRDREQRATELQFQNWMYQNQMHQQQQQMRPPC